MKNHYKLIGKSQNNIPIYAKEIKSEDSTIICFFYLINDKYMRFKEYSLDELKWASLAFEEFYEMPKEI